VAASARATDFRAFRPDAGVDVRVSAHSWKSKRISNTAALVDGIRKGPPVGLGSLLVLMIGGGRGPGFDMAQESGNGRDAGRGKRFGPRA